MEKNVLGANLVKYRKARNLTQADIAEQLNFTCQTISNWERGISTPDIDSLTKLANLFGVTMGVLCGTEAENSPKQTTVRKGIFDHLKSNNTVQLKRYSPAVAVCKWSLILTVIFWFIAFLLSLTAPLSAFSKLVNSLFTLLSTLAFATAEISLLFAKRYTNKIWVRVIFFLIISLSIVLSIITVSLNTFTEKTLIVITIIFSIFSALSLLFSELALRDKIRRDCPKISTFKAWYYICFIISCLLYSAGYTSPIINFVCFCLLFCFKENKYTLYLGVKGSGEEYVTPTPLWDGKPQEFSNKELLSGFVLKGIIITLFIFSYVFPLTTITSNDLDTASLYLKHCVILPSVFLLVSFFLKKTEKPFVNVLAGGLFVLFLALSIFTFLVEWKNTLPLIVSSLILIIVDLAVALTYLHFYAKNVKFTVKYLLTIGFCLGVALSIYCLFRYDDMSTLNCWLVGIIMQLSILLLSFSAEDRYVPY